jgi:hypothetical protein
MHAMSIDFQKLLVASSLYLNDTLFPAPWRCSTLSNIIMVFPSQNFQTYHFEGFLVRDGALSLTAAPIGQHHDLSRLFYSLPLSVQNRRSSVWDVKACERRV